MRCQRRRRRGGGGGGRDARSGLSRITKSLPPFTRLLLFANLLLHIILPATAGSSAESKPVAESWRREQEQTQRQQRPRTQRF